MLEFARFEQFEAGGYQDHAKFFVGSNAIDFGRNWIFVLLYEQF